MFLWSKKVSQKGIKVILTGEGSDEILWGYDSFREAKVRQFWSKNPESRLRPLLLKKIYSYLPQFQNRLYFNLALDFFKKDLTQFDDPFYTHATRISNSLATHLYFTEEMKEHLKSHNPLEVLEASLPEDYGERSLLEKPGRLNVNRQIASSLRSADFSGPLR